MAHQVVAEALEAVAVRQVGLEVLVVRLQAVLVDMGPPVGVPIRVHAAMVAMVVAPILVARQVPSRIAQSTPPGQVIPVAQAVARELLVLLAGQVLLAQLVLLVLQVLLAQRVLLVQ